MQTKAAFEGSGCGTVMSSLKRGLVAVALLGAAFFATTLWALESGGVALVETRAPEGALRTTRVWYVELDRELWLEAGAPENGWFQDVRQNPFLTFEANGVSARYAARIVEAPSGHARIRSLVRKKYSFRDRWVSLIADTSRSVAVQLVPTGE